MKTIKLVVSAILFSTIAYLFNACSDNEDGDTQKPTIDFIEPSEGSQVKIGSALHLLIHLSDNVGVSSYKVNIHSAEGHPVESTKSEEHEVVIFEKSWNLTGDKDITIDHSEIIIPTTAKPGDYHIVVFCIDKSGVENYAARNIRLVE